MRFGCLNVHRMRFCGVTRGVVIVWKRRNAVTKRAEIIYIPCSTAVIYHNKSELVRRQHALTNQLDTYIQIRCHPTNVEDETLFPPLKRNCTGFSMNFMYGVLRGELI